MNDICTESILEILTLSVRRRFYVKNRICEINFHIYIYIYIYVNTVNYWLGGSHTLYDVTLDVETTRKFNLKNKPQTTLMYVKFIVFVSLQLHGINFTFFNTLYMRKGDKRKRREKGTTSARGGGKRKKQSLKERLLQLNARILVSL